MKGTADEREGNDSLVWQSRVIQEQCWGQAVTPASADIHSGAPCSLNPLHTCSSTAAIMGQQHEQAGSLLVCAGCLPQLPTAEGDICQNMVAVHILCWSGLSLKGVQRVDDPCSTQPRRLLCKQTVSRTCSALGIAQCSASSV